MVTRSLSIPLLSILIGCSLNSGAAQDVSIGRARELLKRGEYKQAQSVFASLIEKSSNDVDSQQGLLTSLIETGEYAAAEKKAREYLSTQAANTSARITLGEILLETGRYEEAAAETERASKDARGVEYLRANLARARALFAGGKETEAQSSLQGFVGYYNSNHPRSAEELTLVARGLTLLEKFKDANELYMDARDADATFASAFIAQGELLNQKYNYGEAASLFRDSLKINPNSADALLGLARSKQLESNEEPMVLAERALKTNPNHTGALVLRAWLELEADKGDAAAELAGRALAVNANCVPAIAIRAAIQYLRNQPEDLEAEIKRALAVNPKAGELFDTLAHFSVINRRYADAVTFGKRAVELSPRLWPARTNLGIQLLRVGREAEGRAELERAFAGDPFNIWAKNFLDLLDSMREFRDQVRGSFIVRTSPKEADVVAVYAADLLEEANKKLAAKYRFTPQGPISVELFANHEDFAVKSLGLPGLGALGVCFGQVIAMDSPLAREAGQFNWGGTLWHEFTHVITLQTTAYRIPRWFSEGLSVYEERRARPGWGDNWSLETLKAFTGGRFVKIEDMEAAFTRPRAPDQVPLAYFQASMVCEYVEEKHGFEAILKMLALYRENVKTPDVLSRVLNQKPGDFDREFNEYLRNKTAAWVEVLGKGPVRDASKDDLLATLRAKPNDYFANLRLGMIYRGEGDFERAIQHLKRASEVFPFYAGDGNPYTQLVEIYESRGQKTEAAETLAALSRVDEDNIDALKKLARLRLELGDRPGALEALQTSFLIYPFDAALHKLAGDIYLEQSNAAGSLREYAVAVALDPPDKAAAHYDLARAFAAAGKNAEARRSVLRALEVAPGYEQAQDLLLKLKRSNP
jgi:tetratricopeptide (TPR) repeat protein